VDFIREKPPHKYTGTESSLSSNKDIHQKPDTSVDPPADRQHCSTSTSSENGKANKSNANKSDKGNLVISTVKRDDPDSGVYTLKAECRGRLRVTKLDGSQRIDAKQTCVPKDHKDMGYTLNRPVCVSHIPPDRKLLQLEDPHGLAVNALRQTWGSELLYAFPPFCLVGRCLEKTRRHKASLKLIAPVWINQPWYPVLLEMSVDHPRLITKEGTKTLIHPTGILHPLLLNGTLKLAAWRISGAVKKQRDYQKRLQTLSHNPEQSELDAVTEQPGKSFRAGVVKGKWIRFLAI